MAAVQPLTEPDLFRSYWDDGLLDLLFGLALLSTGVGWQTDLGAFAVIQAPFWIVMWAPLHKRVVEPRAGFVRFSLSRRKRNARALGSTLALGLGALAVMGLAAWLARGRDAGPDIARAIAGLPAVLVALGAALAGVLTGSRRLHAYGLALAAAAVATVLVGAGPAPPLVAVGLLAAASGAILLIRFVRDSRAFAARPRP